MPFRKPQGYSRVYAFPGEAPIEADTFTCAHCQRIVTVSATARPEDIGGMCRSCSDGGKTSHGLICTNCHKIYSRRGCVSFMQKVEAVEARHRTLVSIGLVEEMSPRRKAEIEQDRQQRKRLDALL